jgi:hypothetical protein
MSFIAMDTNNPLGHRPFQQMGLAGQFDFPGAPIPQRVPPELLAGNAAKQQAIHPPAVVPIDSPWDSDEPVMMLGAAAVTSTQTIVPTTNTTPQATSVMASGQPVWSAWFSEQSIVPGISNWEVGVGVIALVALFKAMR